MPLRTNPKCKRKLQQHDLGKAPNANYSGLNTLKLSVYDAVASFNYGGMATIDLLSFLNLEPGYFHFTMKMCKQQNFTGKDVPHGEYEEAVIKVINLW